MPLELYEDERILIESILPPIILEMEAIIQQLNKPTE
jgi:hypothetical protein